MEILKIDVQTEQEVVDTLEALNPRQWSICVDGKDDYVIYMGLKPNRSYKQRYFRFKIFENDEQAMNYIMENSPRKWEIVHKQGICILFIDPKQKWNLTYGKEAMYHSKQFKEYVL